MVTYKDPIDPRSFNELMPNYQNLEGSNAHYNQDQGTEDSNKTFLRMLGAIGVGGAAATGPTPPGIGSLLMTLLSILGANALEGGAMKDYKQRLLASPRLGQEPYAARLGVF